MEKTTIEITDDVWRQLHERKGRGESFNDVVKGLLESAEAEVNA